MVIFEAERVGGVGVDCGRVEVGVFSGEGCLGGG
jgi:hypothetical protein